ncbi:MAG: histidine kinase [Acidobacteriota bacterium]
MNLLYSPESRAERLIAGGRVVLAASSLFAVWLDPTEPAKFVGVAYALLTAYVIYATVVAFMVARAAAPSNRQRLITHAFDLAFFSLFTYFTSGPAQSPFIAYFVFSMVCATLRWQWRGTLWTAIAALAAFLGLGVYFAEFLGDSSIELTPFIIRAVYLAVFAVLLGYLGAHEERTRREMAMLASWPHPIGGRPGDVLRELLATSARILGVERAVAITTEREEPWLSVAELDRGAFCETRAPPDAFDPLVAPELEGSSFLCAAPDNTDSEVLFRGQSLGTRKGKPLNSRFVARFGAGPVLSLPLRGETIEGRLFFLGKRNLTLDDLVLGEIVSAILAARLDQAFLIQQLRAAAVDDERVRLARDLHDGVLQSFTGIGLQIGAARRLAEEQPAGVAAHLLDLQRLLADEQRDLRFFIQELQRHPLPENVGPLGERLRELALRIERTWGLRVGLQTAGLGAEPDAKLAREIYNLVREAVVNAARHGGAHNVEVIVEEHGGRVTVAVADDGHGFPYSGAFSDGELRARDLGPRTLRERTCALGGALQLASGPEGARIEMSLPTSGAVQ